MSNFTVEVGEYYVDTSGEEHEVWPGVSESLTTVKGKLENTELVSLAENGSSFFEKYITNHVWLTSSVRNYSASKQVYFRVNDVSHPVKVWCLYQSGETISLMWNIGYTDGSSPIGFIDITPTEPTSLLEIDAHAIAREADASVVGDKTIDYYIIQMGGGRAVRVDVTNVHSENHTELYLLNRFGAVECLNCYGEKSEGGENETESYTRALDLSPTSYDRTIFEVQKNQARTIKVNTGYKSLTERRWISDLLRSPYKQAWIKVEDSMYPLPGETFGIEPVRILTNSFDVDTTSEDLLSIEIEIKIAHN
jgi:hypothetical protein